MFSSSTNIGDFIDLLSCCPFDSHSIKSSLKNVCDRFHPQSFEWLVSHAVWVICGSHSNHYICSMMCNCKRSVMCIFGISMVRQSQSEKIQRVALNNV